MHAWAGSNLSTGFLKNHHKISQPCIQYIAQVVLGCLAVFPFSTVTAGGHLLESEEGAFWVIFLSCSLFLVFADTFVALTILIFLIFFLQETCLLLFHARCKQNRFYY